MNFKKLHQQKEPLLLCNVWDAQSASLAEKLNFKAVGTSSAAISSILGKNDGEGIEFKEMIYFVERITSKTSLPLTVDLEGGYSRHSSEIVENIYRLIDLGVVGINIEDSTVHCHRELVDAEIFSQTLGIVITEIKKHCKDFFINVRTDTFLLDYLDPIQETKRRIKLYEDVGADGVFIPGIETENNISEIVACTKLPINVMCFSNLPNFDILQKLGVKRISMGNFLFNKMYQYLEENLKTVNDSKSFKCIF